METNLFINWIQTVIGVAGGILLILAPNLVEVTDKVFANLFFVPFGILVIWFVLYGSKIERDEII